MAVEATPAQLPLVAARLLLAAFYFYFMLGLTFNAALRTNGALMLAYALAALGGAITVPVATYSLFVLLCANFIGGAGWPKLPLVTGSPGFSTARPSRHRRATCGNTRSSRSCRCPCC